MQVRDGTLSHYLLRFVRTPYTRLCASSPTDNPRILNLIRAAVLASSVLLMLPGAWGHSATVVEFAHLPAGLAAWQRHSLGIYRVCGPVSKFLYALPAHLAGIRLDYPDSFDSDVQARQEWDLGRIFQAQNSHRYRDIYRWSRLLPIFLTLLGACLVCEWSSRLFGAWPGLVSLCAWCWMPPTLAHGSLVTSDMPSAVALILAARCFWAFLLGPSPARAVLSGLTLGLAAATKFTLLILYPCWAILLLGRAVHGGRPTAESGGRGISPARWAALGLVALLTSVVVVDTLYLFRDVGFRPEQWRSGDSSLARGVRELGAWPGAAWLLRIPLPIPLEFLRGLDFQMADTERVQSAYLLGRTRVGGWWYWYAAALLIKTPLPALALFGLALARLPSALQASPPRFWASLCLLIPAAEAGLAIAATTGTGTNAAFRYLLPSLGLLCVWAGAAWDARRLIRSTVACFLGWLAINAVAGLPDHLGWRNEAGWAWEHRSGRPALIGDSLDWSQDLARLGEWVEERSRGGSTLVCVYGLGAGDAYGLIPPRARPTSDPGPEPEYLAVSDNILFGYEPQTYVGVGGGFTSIGEYGPEILDGPRPYSRAGRSIRIYRLRDLARGRAAGRVGALPGPPGEITHPVRRVGDGPSRPGDPDDGPRPSLVGSAEPVRGQIARESAAAGAPVRPP
jgi:hypothetical protein